jgi:hypothetical protein
MNKCESDLTYAGRIKVNILSETVTKKFKK